PPTGDFASVKGIATFLGIHLGVDDDAEGTTEEVKSRIQDKTAAETFHSFRDVRSAYWHAARHQTAQGFIDKFVRQVSGLVLFHKLEADLGARTSRKSRTSPLLNVFAPSSS